MWRQPCGQPGMRLKLTKRLVPALQSAAMHSCTSTVQSCSLRPTITLLLQSSKPALAQGASVRRRKLCQRRGKTRQHAQAQAPALRCRQIHRARHPMHPKRHRLRSGCMQVA